MFEKSKSCARSPLAPLKKGGITLKVPLLKGDLGGSTSFNRSQRDFLNIFLNAKTKIS